MSHGGYHHSLATNERRLTGTPRPDKAHDVEPLSGHHSDSAASPSRKGEASKQQRPVHGRPAPSPVIGPSSCLCYGYVVVSRPVLAKVARHVV